MEVRPALPSDFDRIYLLLQLFENPRMSRDDWRRMLFDLPWDLEEPHRGYLLLDGDEPVGFFATVFSRRVIRGKLRKLCYTSSWIVKEPYRGAALALCTPIHKLEGYTIINPSPSVPAHDVFVRMGFHPLETAQVLIPLIPSPRELLRTFGASVSTSLDAMRARLDGEGRTILEAAARSLAAQALLRVGDRRCHVVAVRSPWKTRWRLAHVLYASDWDLLGEHPGLVGAALAPKLGTLGLRVDSRHLAGRRIPWASQSPFVPPRLWRPADPDLEPADIDQLYTELLGLRW